MKYFKRICWSVIALALIICISMETPVRFGAFSSPSVQRVAVGEQTQEAQAASRGVYNVAAAGLQKIAQDGVIELYFDAYSYSIAVYETISGNYWYMMPQAETVQSPSNASVLSFDIELDGELRTVDSQDNSLALGGASYELITSDSGTSGIRVHYDFAMEEEPDKTLFGADVEYVLEDGNLVTSVGLSENEESGCRIINMRCFEYFGASAAPSADGYLLVPDGSGAVIDLSVPDDGFREVSIPVYGEDITAENSEDTTGTAIFPVFGVKRATGAFIAIIRDGDALATIKANRGSGSDCNKVYSEYRITNSSRMVINGEDNELFSSEAYDGKVTICYRFLSETNANFNGMSISCREQLIRDGILSTRVVEKQEHLPLNVSVIGAVDQYIDTFSVRFRTARVMSGFEETMDMLMQMKAKGIDSLNVRYIGMFSGGSNQNDLAGVTLNRELGSHSKYRELCAYADSMKFSIFANLNVLSAAVGTVEKESGQAANILSADASYVEENNLCRFNDYISTVYSKNLLSPGYIKEAVDSFTKNTSNVEIDGICIDDAGSILYSDFGETYYNREEAKDVISEDVAPLTTNRGGMVSNGNMYMIKQADYIIDMPVADDDYSASYTPVPFLQMVLHGTVEYSLEAINTSEDSTESFLKSIEYGAIPSFVFTYTDDSYTNEMGVHYYADWLTAASECYTEANSALYNLVDVRMVNNYRVAEDVKCTEYEDGTLIYVNYSDTDQSVDGVTVKANSFTVV